MSAIQFYVSLIWREKENATMLIARFLRLRLKIKRGNNFWM